jgi:hypothetical protein
VPAPPPPGDHAQLSALADTLDSLTKRVTAAAERYHGTAQEDLATDLYEVERSLRSASRRLGKLLRATRP